MNRIAMLVVTGFLASMLFACGGEKDSSKPAEEAKPAAEQMGNSSEHKAAPEAAKPDAAPAEEMKKAD